MVSSGHGNLGNATSAVILGDASGDTGVLSYTDGAATYTRGFMVNSGGGEIDNVGSGLLTVVTGGLRRGH